MSLDYCFADALFVSMSFVPGCLVLRFLLPHVSFSELKKGIINLILVVAAVLLTDILLVIWCHIMMNGFMMSFHNGFPTILVNPAFISIIMLVLTGGDYVLSRFLKSHFQDESHPVTFTSDYKKVTLDISEILYVESEYLKGIREWDMDKSTLFTPCLEAQARFQAQIDLQKLQEYAQRYKPADYKED